MAKYNSRSSNRSQQQQLALQSPQTSILASCYSVKPSTPVVAGFHYCTMPDAGKNHSLSAHPLCPSIMPLHFPHTHAFLQGPSGMPEVPSGKKHSISPPLDAPLTCGTAELWTGDADADDAGTPGSNGNGEAAQTIPGECERLFCDTLAAIFLGGRRFAGQESLGMGAYHHRSIRSSCTAQAQERGGIQLWVEVWDYSSDAIYRGFVTGVGEERTFFVFFGEGAVGHGLKSGLIALFELASMPALGCSQIVVCVRRSEDTDGLDVVRSLGWCGFGLTTLEPWVRDGCQDSTVSSEWLFLSAEV